MATWNWKYEHDNNIWSFRLMIILMVTAAVLVTVPFFFPELTEGFGRGGLVLYDI